MSQITPTQNFSGACVTLATAQAIVSGFDVLITNWDYPNYDTDQYWSNAQPDRFTIPASLDGAYFQVTLNLEWNASGGTNNSDREHMIRINGSTWGLSSVAPTTIASGDFTVVSFTCVPVQLHAGDYVQIFVNQDSGVGRQIQNLFGVTRFSIHRV